MHKPPKTCKPMMPSAQASVLEQQSLQYRSIAAVRQTCIERPQDLRETDACSTEKGFLDGIQGRKQVVQTSQKLQDTLAAWCLMCKYL